MRVGESLGQLRVAGKIPWQYSEVSARPYPYKSELDLIDQGLLTNLEPIWGVYDWPKFVKAPKQPSFENEVYKIRRGAAQIMWNKAGTWNLNRKDPIMPPPDRPMDEPRPGDPMDGLGALGTLEAPVTGLLLLAGGGALIYYALHSKKEGLGVLGGVLAGFGLKQAIS